MTDVWHLAIDFGTSNSAAAHTAPGSGSVETLSLTHRSNLMPSAVYVETGGDGDRGGVSVLTGDTALYAGRRDPMHLVLSPKRFIDHDSVQLGGDDIETRRVIGAVLTTIVERATEQHEGTAPTSVTLTHPEQWSTIALGNLVDAARSEKWAQSVDLRVIAEPRAAAIHYAAQQKVPAGEHVAVFDFGGGTLDVAVLRAEESGDYRVVAARGDNSLGGRTVDNLVYRWLIEQIDHDDPELADSLRSAPASVMNSLQENIRQAKEMLSDTSSATVTVSSPSGDRDVLITRSQFNEIIAQPIERAREMTQAVLREAGVDGSSTKIYLTGGSSRIPLVHEQLAQVGRVARLDDPKTVVARGALVATLRGFSERTGRGTRQAGSDPSSPCGAAAAGGAQSGELPGYQRGSFGQDVPRPQVPPAGRPPVGQPAAAAGTSGKSGSAVKRPVILGAGVVVLLVVVAVVAGWMSGMFKDDDLTVGVDAPFITPNDGTPEKLPFTELIPGVEEYVPEEFIQTLNPCDVEQSDIAVLPWSIGEYYDSRKCHEQEDWYYSYGVGQNVDLLGGSDAEEAMLKLNDSPYAEIENISLKKGEAYYVSGDFPDYTSRGERLVLWYPDTKFLMELTVFESGGTKSDKGYQPAAEAFLRDHGFM